MSPSLVMHSASPLLFGTLVFLVSCSDDMVTTDPTGPGALAAAAATVTNDVSFHEPFDFVEFIACAAGGAGELVEFTGFVSGSVHTTINGNTATGHLTGVLHLSGEGLTTGEKYEFTNAIQSIFSESLINDQFSQTFLVGITVATVPGPGNDLLVHPTLHLTVNANGEVTAEVGQFFVECK